MLKIASERRRVARLRGIGLGGKTIAMKAVEGFEEQGHVAVALEAAEAFLSVEDGHADPATDHRAVLPTVDAPGRAADGAHQVPDGIGRRERARQRARELQIQDGQRFLQPLAQGRGGVIVTVALEPRDEALQPAAGRVGPGSPVGLAHLAEHPALGLPGQVVVDVSHFVELAALDQDLIAEDLTQGSSQTASAVEVPRLTRGGGSGSRLFS